MFHGQRWSSLGPGVSEGFQEGILGQRAVGFQACPTLAGKFLALFLCSTFLHLPTALPS